MLARGKHGKPTSAFPPFPPSLNIPQQRRDIHISTAPTIRPYIKVRLKTPALKPYTWGWAKLNFRSGPSAVAKSKWRALAGAWPLKRLVALWNDLPGVAPVQKFTNRRLRSGESSGFFTRPSVEIATMRTPDDHGRLELSRFLTPRAE